MRLLTLAVCVPLALAHLASHAQGVILRDQDVSESKLIEALTPERSVRTRSIRVSPSTDQASPVKKAAAASMLITFETNSAELKPEARKMLDSLGKAMTSDKLSNFRFAIEGHADPRGGEQFNLELSQRRAESVVSYLTENHHIDASRLQPIGKGQSELFNRSQIDAPENRRVTVKTLVQ